MECSNRVSHGSDKVGKSALFAKLSRLKDSGFLSTYDEVFQRVGHNK